MNLIKQKCVPCEGIGAPMIEKIYLQYLKEIPEWKLNKNKRIERNFKFKNFKKTMEFVNEIAKIAEKEGHHPNLYIHSWNKLKITLYTHALNGLTKNDFILASKIDALRQP